MGGFKRLKRKAVMTKFTILMKMSQVLSEKGAELSHAVRKAESYEREVLVDHFGHLSNLDHLDHLDHLGHLGHLGHIGHLGYPHQF